MLYLRFLPSASHAFRTHEWFNVANDDVLLLRMTPPLVGFLVGFSTLINMTRQYGATANKRNCVEQSPSWEDSSCSAGQLEVSVLCSQLAEQL
jgi:hypothetical protein